MHHQRCLAYFVQETAILLVNSLSVITFESKETWTNCSSVSQLRFIQAFLTQTL